MTGFFKGIQQIKYEGPASDNDFAFRHYNPDEIVMGKPMKDHLRFAAAYWHSFAWEGGDPFGGRTLDRPWFGDSMEAAKLKADVAFEMFQILNVPYFCFHDADVRPEGDDFCRPTRRNSRRDRGLLCRQDGRDGRPKPSSFGARPTCSRTDVLWLVQLPIQILTFLPSVLQPSKPAWTLPIS